MNEKSVHVFYRVSKRIPPDEDFYLTPRERYGDPPPGASEETRRAWDAWSFYNSEETARLCGLEHTHLGGRIVRFCIPEGAGITWEPHDDEGHQNLRGDKAVLSRYWDAEYVARVRIKPAKKERSQ